MPQSRIPVPRSAAQEDCLRAWAGAIQTIKADDAKKAAEAYQRFLNSTASKNANIPEDESSKVPKLCTDVKIPAGNTPPTVEKTPPGRHNPGRPEGSNSDRWVVISHDDSDWELI